MIILETRNASHSASQIARMLFTQGVEGNEANRLYSPTPVAVRQYAPWERLIFRPELELNPFAEMMKAIWTLCGRLDVKTLADKNHPDVARSEDGQMLRGAYGYRARDHFVLLPELGDPEDPFPVGQIDQMQTVIGLLKTDPNRTDCIIQLWDAGFDLGLNIIDRPLATQLHFRVNDIDGGLDMTVYYRECDLQQAASDSIAFTMMQSFIAESIARTPGRYYQIMQVVWAPTKLLSALREFSEADYRDPYEDFSLQKTTLACIEPAAFLAECQTFLDEGVVLGMRDRFLRKTVEPMFRAWNMYLNSRYPSAVMIAEEIVLDDWRVACVDWLSANNRKEK